MHGLKLTERFKSTEVHAFGSSSSKTNCGNSSKALVAAATKPHNYLNRNKTMLPSWSKTKSRTTNNNSTSSVADLAPSVVCVVELATIAEEGSVNLTAERNFVVPTLHYNKIPVLETQVYSLLQAQGSVVGHNNSEKGNTVACSGATRCDTETKDGRQCTTPPSFGRGHDGATEMQANDRAHDEVTAEISDKRGGKLEREVGVFIN
ncbi:hypothetical protein GmHk_03G007228 [Glycine max]|nr:hypothetical protein GmHk_03G007228 [Glycine max]